MLVKHIFCSQNIYIFKFNVSKQHFHAQSVFSRSNLSNTAYIRQYSIFCVEKVFSHLFLDFQGSLKAHRIEKVPLYEV